MAQIDVADTGLAPGEKRKSGTDQEEKPARYWAGVDQLVSVHK